MAIATNIHGSFRAAARSPLFGIAVWALLWAGMRTLAEANLDPYGDMLESWILGQTWSWGTYKHPPLMNWVARMWFSIWPNGTGPYKLLAYVNVAVGLLGIVRLARLHGIGRWTWPVVVIAVCGLPESTLAAKFNANAVLLSLWPWVAVAWTHAFVLRKGNWASLALGVMSALAMLGKYYSGVMLAGLWLSSLLTAEGRRWYRTPQPWLALLVFCVCLAPHLRWQMAHGWASLSYVEEQGDGAVGWKELWHFALSPLIYWGLAWMVAALLLRSGEAGEAGFFQRLLWCWKPNGWNDTLFWLAVMPWLITLVFGLSGFVTLSLPWSIPIGYAYPVLWVRNLSSRVSAPPRSFSRAATRLHVFLLLGLVLAGPLLARHYALHREPSYFLPREEAATAILRGWKARHPDVPLKWVGGQWSENGFLAFYGDQDLITLPGTPDDPRARISVPYRLDGLGGVMICRGGWSGDAGSGGDGQGERAQQASYLNTPCVHQVQAWLHAHGRLADPLWVKVKREGGAFPNAPSYVYVVYEYVPEAQSALHAQGVQP